MLAKVTDPRYRTFWPRVGAALVDTLVVMVPVGLLDWLVWSVVTTPMLLAAWYVAASLAFTLYSIYFHAASGQTVGKRVAGVRVFAVSGQPLSLFQAVMRDLVPLLAVCWMMLADLPTVLLGTNPADLVADQATLTPTQLLAGSAVMVWGILELVTMLTNSRRRSVHDFIAGSVVMRVTGGHPVSAGDVAEG